MCSYFSKSFFWKLAIIFAVLLGFTGTGTVWAGQSKEEVCHMEGEAEISFSDDCSLIPEYGEGFTNGSLRGTYSIHGVSEGGAPAQSAGVGLLRVDGKGSVKVKITLNVPAPHYPDERVVRTIKAEGHYKVNSDGMGYFKGLGLSGDVNDIFVITDAYKKRGKKLAKELFVMSGNVDPNAGVLVTFYLKRLP